MSPLLIVALVTLALLDPIVLGLHMIHDKIKGAY